jgi:hypothetical protein
VGGGAQIGSVKSKVEADRGAEAFPAAHMMIVFQGKVRGNGPAAPAKPPPSP